MINRIISSIVCGTVIGIVGIMLSFLFGTPFGLAPGEYGQITGIASFVGCFIGSLQESER